MPRELDMVEAGRQMPLPPAKPEIPSAVAATEQAVQAKADVVDPKADTGVKSSRDQPDKIARRLSARS